MRADGVTGRTVVEPEEAAGVASPRRAPAAGADRAPTSRQDVNEGSGSAPNLDATTPSDGEAKHWPSVPPRHGRAGVRHGLVTKVPTLAEWLRQDTGMFAYAYERWRKAKLAEAQASAPPVPKHERPKCGARCRSKDGAPCEARAVWDDERNAPRNGRCRMHGGLSTGARSPEGRARCKENGRRGAEARWRRRHEGSVSDGAPVSRPCERDGA